MLAATADPKVDAGVLRQQQEHQRTLDKRLARELRFTRIYRENMHRSRAELEIACLNAQYPAILEPLEEGDWFAGRIDRPLVGVDPERGGITEAGYFCRFETLQRIAGDREVDDQLRADAQELIAFWSEHALVVKCRPGFSADALRHMSSDDYYSAREITYPAYGFGGPVPDYALLVRLGIRGLAAMVNLRMQRAAREQMPLLQSLLEALAIFTRCARWYAQQARELAARATSQGVAERMRSVAANLEHIATEEPETYAQGIQLFWLYSIIALPRNYGRLDVTLGDLLMADLDNGRLTWLQAKELTIGLWRLIEARGDLFNNRIVIGGRGRANEANADRFALLALQVQKEVGGPIPQLSLRWYEGMNPLIWEEALETIAAGSTHPILYSDDVNVPAVAKAFGVSVADAEQYVMYGCGEYIIEGRSVGSPNVVMNIAKALVVTLNGGVDPTDGKQRGLALGTLEDFATFEDLQAAYAKQLELQIRLSAEIQAATYRITGEHLAFPFLSLLYDDCLARGKGILAGGVRCLGGIIESFGNSTVGDALYAIKTLVYGRKIVAAGEMLTALRDNFRGHERILALCRAVPKFGNDHAEADGMCVWVNTLVARLAQEQARRVGLDTFLNVQINNGDHVTFGRGTAATADGRLSGQPLSNGNQPTAGADRSGVTSLLNSMAKLDPSIHAGVTQNLKLSRGTMRQQRGNVSALLKAYFASGGTQVMITVTDRGELEDALEHPERYANLIVRVGGYSDRFVDLPRDVQLDIVKRTLY